MSPEADTAFQKMLAKRPEERYQTGGEVVTALRACPSPVAVMSATKMVPDGDRLAEAAERTGDYSDQQTLDGLTFAGRPAPPRDHGDPSASWSADSSWAR